MSENKNSVAGNMSAAAIEVHALQCGYEGKVVLKDVVLPKSQRRK